MEGGQGVEPPSKPLSLWEALDEYYPYFLSLGVTPEEYWHGDPTLLNGYVEAQEYHNQRRDIDAWRMGAYVYQAIGALVPVLHAFAKQGTKAEPYLEEPFGFKQTMTEEQKIQDGINRFAELATRINKRFE